MSISRWLCALTLCMVSLAAEAQAPTSWRSVGPGGGGSLFSPTFNPFNHNQLTLACDMSGQYKSSDLGNSWALTPFTTLQVSGYAPKVGYTSSASVQYMLDSTSGSQVPVVSSNGGATWSPIAVDPTGGDAWYLESDPTTTNRLFISDYASLHFSKDSGHTWITVATGNNSSGIVLGGAYFDGLRIIAGTSLGVFASTNGGSSFTKLTTPGIPSTEQIVSFAASKTSTVTRFFVVTLPAGSVYGGMAGDNCYSFVSVYSLDFGTSTSWNKRMNGIPSSAHFFFVKTAGNDIYDVYLGGGDDMGYPSVYKSTNGGVTWANVLKTVNNANIITGWQGYHGDRDWGYDQLCFGLAVCPNDSTRVAFTGYGFCHITTNGGTSWRQVYDSYTTENPAGAVTPKGLSYLGIGLENTSCWTIAWSDISNVWAGYTDIDGARSTDGGNTWSFNFTGDSYNSAYQIIKTSTGTLYMATSTVHDMYESTHLTDSRIDGGSGAVLASTNKGVTWTPVGSLGHIVMGVAADPTNSKRLYASVAHSTAGGIYVCQDVTKGTLAVWTKLAAPPRTQGHAFNIRVLNDGSLVCTYSGRITTNFTDSSGVFVSTNHGLSWVDRSAPNMHWWTKDVTVDPTDTTQNTWYVGVYSGWGGTANGRGGLYRTKNRGLTWTEVLQLDRVGSCAVNPTKGSEVYATTETQGLWFSSTANLTTPTFSRVASFPFRQPERVFFNPFKPGEIWVTSFGNGLRIGTIPTA